MVGRGDDVQSSDREERDSMTAVIAEQGLGLCCWRWSFFVGGGVGREVAGIAKFLFFGEWAKEAARIVIFLWWLVFYF